jgi:hypothetical protein
MKGNQRKAFTSDLLRQDEAVSDTAIKELRSRLTQALENAERRANAVRRATIVSCVVLVAAVLLEVLVIGLADRFEMSAHWIKGLGAGVVLVLLVVAGTLLTLYNDKFRSAVGERRTELQMAILADLQRQVADLKGARNKPAADLPDTGPASQGR